MSNIDQQWILAIYGQNPRLTIIASRRESCKLCAGSKVSAHWSYQGYKGVQTYHMQKEEILNVCEESQWLSESELALMDSQGWVFSFSSAMFENPLWLRLLKTYYLC